MQKKAVITTLSIMLATIVASVALVFIVGPMVSADSSGSKIVVLDRAEYFNIEQLDYDSELGYAPVQLYGLSGLGAKYLSQFFDGVDGYSFEEIHIVVPEGVTRIKGWDDAEYCAFDYWSGDYNVSIPDCHQYITSIVLPRSLKELYSGAVYHCSIKYIVIPNSVTYIDSCAFITGNFTMYCECSEEYAVGHWDSGWGNYCDAEVVWNAVVDNHGLVYQLIDSGTYQGTYAVIDYIDNDAEVTIPSSYNGIPVKAIWGDPFYENEIVTSMAISDGIEYIESWTFYACPNLESIYVPSSVTFIGDDAFRMCDNATIYFEVASPLNSWDPCWDEEFIGNCVWNYRTKFNVTFDSNGGSLVDNQIVNRNGTVNEPTAPTKDGYAFINWLLNGVVYDFSTPVTTDVALTAEWKYVYTVRFTYNGDWDVYDYQFYQELEVLDGECIDVNDVPIPDDCEAADFLYWVDGHGVEFDFENTPITENLDLCAEWEYKYYTISFYEPDQTTLIEDQTIRKGDLATEPSWNVDERLSRVLGDFRGWCIPTTNNDYWDCNSTTLLPSWWSGDSISVYAEYENSLTEYLIQFSWDDDWDGCHEIYPSSGFDDDYYYAYEGETFRDVFDYYGLDYEPDPNEPECRFGGWFVDYSYGLNFDDLVGGDTTIFCEWILYHPVYLNDENGNVLYEFEWVEDRKLADIMYDELGYIPDGPEKEGYTFMYWCNEMGYNSDAIYNDDLWDYDLYPCYEPDEITVYFDSCEGWLTDGDDCWYGYWGDTISGLPTVEFEGGDFIGWFVDLDDDQPFDFRTPIESYDLTLYAKYEYYEYTVEFNSNGGSDVPSQTVKWGDVMEWPEDPVLEGYTLFYWRDDKGNVWFPHDEGYYVCGSVAFTAEWEINFYYVTFEPLNGGDDVTHDVEHGDTITEPTIEYEGHMFLGWFRDLQDTTAFDFDTPITSDLTLYAKWEINTYWVTFNSCGGENVPSQQIEYLGKAIAPSTTYTGHTLDGWYVDANYSAKFDFDTEITESRTLYAKWTINQYTVTFSSNGSVVTTQTVNHGGKASRPTTDPTCEGYTFQGWYLNNEEYNFNTEVTGSITLTAQWQLKTYTITFNSNQGSAIDSQTVNHGGKVSMPTPDPIREGYTFQGWHLNGNSYDFINTVVTGNLTLVASWKLNTYTVTFNPDNSTAETTATVNYNTKVSRPTNPVREGYTFQGWFINNTEYDFETPVTTNITLKAVWTIKTYTITFNCQDGSAVTTQIVNYGEKVLLPTTPVRDGYTFLGWYFNDTEYDFETVITEDKTLTAHWEIIPAKSEEKNNVGLIAGIAGGSVAALGSLASILGVMFARKRRNK